MQQLDLFPLKNKTALLTGASGLLGEAMALGLARAGVKIIINGRNAEKLKMLSDKIQAQGVEVWGWHADVTDEDACRQTLLPILEKVEKLDILINNAYQGPTGSIESSTAEQFTKSYDVAVISAFRLVQISLPYLKLAAKNNTKGASIINISSMYGSVSPDPSIYGESGFNNPPFYGAAKAGLAQLTRYFACHLAKDNIRANAISPGPILRDTIAQAHPEFYQSLCAKIPMHRPGKAEEIVGPVLFLASDAASFITGSVLPVDGGWTAW